MNDEIDFSQGKRGAVDQLPAGKTRVTIRLDDDVLDWFRAAVHWDSKRSAADGAR